MESLWRKQSGFIDKTHAVHSQNNEKNWDVIVVGAGMAGLLTAFYLNEEGKKVLVLEANKVASGQTERTTAKITSQHGLKYSSLIKLIGAGKAGIYARSNEAAIQEFEKLISMKGIECQYERVSSFLYTRQDEEVLKEEAEAAARLGIDAFFTTETELPFLVTGSVAFRQQAQFSPLEFVKHISAELEIWERTMVKVIRGNNVTAENIETKEQLMLTADKIVVAAHYPILNVPGFYFLRQHQERSYVLALANAGKIRNMYYGIDQDGLSFRQAGDYLLLGGASHRTGKKGSGGSYDLLLQAAKQYYPECRVKARWAAQDCMPHDGIPFIGKYSVFTPNLYVATGFLKWGMTSSMIAALILRDELNGRVHEWSELFSPQRMYPRAAMKSMLTDVGVSAKGLAKGFFQKPEKEAYQLPCGHGGIVNVDGKRYACYRDEAGILHKISAQCPHMGCELAWNPDEKSWDCPCHGSRFDVDGKLLDNPAQKSNI